MQALQDANADMAKQLQELQEAVAGNGGLKAKAKGKASAKPKLKPKQQPAKKTPPQEPDDEPEAEDSVDEPSEAEKESASEEEDLSEAAKKQRLRRVCQRKPSGKLGVPEKVHLMWKEGGSKRDELQEMLEAAGWDKDRRASSLCLGRNSFAVLFAGRLCGEGAAYPDQHQPKRGQEEARLVHC